MKEVSIEQELRRLGFGHRRIASSVATGKHELYRLDSGEVVGQFRALEALEFALNNK